MEQDPQDKLLLAIQTLVGKLLEPIHTELMEQSARLTAQRYLLEMVYANEFLHNADGFNQFMDGLQDQSRRNPTRAEPMSDELADELSARVATHLQRFQESVSLRIHQGVRD